MRKEVFFYVFFVSVTSWGQDNDVKIEEGDFVLKIDKPYKLLEIREEEEEEIPKRKKKRKKKVFYGIKTTKNFIRERRGNNIITETFHHLKKVTSPDFFVRDIYWYDLAQRKIKKTTKYDPERGPLLHGSYRKTLGKDIVLEEGIFYQGTKHGRWMRYDRKGVLQDKEKYYKGWPKESLIVYHDPVEKTKIKEIIPVEFGEREGNYYRFYQDGKIAVTGEYKWDNRIGEWKEMYPTGKLKKIVNYPQDPFESKKKPYIKQEWNKKGKRIYYKRD